MVSPVSCSLLIATSILVVGLTLAIGLLSGQFSSWQQRRLLTSARFSCNEGICGARWSVVSNIQLNPNDLDAYRVLLSIDEHVNSRRAITWASKTVKLSQTDPDALIELAACMKFHETGVPQEALDGCPPQ